MAASVILAASVVGIFLVLLRLGAVMPWTLFRHATTVLAVYVVATAASAPIMATALLLAILAARRLSQAPTTVPTWFADGTEVALLD